MLSYTAWHLGKPLPEVWGTLVWGLATGTIALATGTIWPIIIVHWLLNIVLDVRLAWPHLPHP
jgi:membrane protease YdiL (CAAX protease family)